MAEPGKQQMGDGQDNYGQAAKQTRNAAKNISKGMKNAGKDAAKHMATKGAEATVNSAAGTVKAGVETGNAVSEIAAGTAAGGPWGAIISAAWAMRHTLFKILICICLVLVLFIACIVSLPNIIFQNIGEMFGDMYDSNRCFPDDYDEKCVKVAYTSRIPALANRMALVVEIYEEDAE